jgi:hypothetical protein
VRDLKSRDSNSSHADMLVNQQIRVIRSHVIRARVMQMRAASVEAVPPTSWLRILVSHVVLPLISLLTVINALFLIHYECPSRHAEAVNASPGPIYVYQHPGIYAAKSTGRPAAETA